ncbi:MAG: hypothetical protein CL816_08425 [Coxiellaceae bacterium]|nr:hypothetical protein [Coxiellaceae bacterium]|tara:strand:- start:676 stop:2082 length:1407 start_codon:yes stop_codon:yes gene_type:complete
MPSHTSNPDTAIKESVVNPSESADRLSVESRETDQPLSCPSTPPPRELSQEELARLVFSENFNRVCDAEIVTVSGPAIMPDIDSKTPSSTHADIAYESLGGGISGKVVGWFCNDLNTSAVVKKGDIPSLKIEFEAGKKVDPKFFIPAKRYVENGSDQALISFDEKGEFDLMSLFESNDKFSVLTTQFVVRLFNLLNSAFVSLSDSRNCHRDIKPENLVLMKDGELKIIDLGMFCSMNDRVDRLCGTEIYGSLWVGLQMTLNKKGLSRLMGDMKAEEMHYDYGSIACVKLLYATALYRKSYVHRNRALSSIINHSTYFFMNDFIQKRQALFGASAQLILACKDLSSQSLIPHYQQCFLKVRDNYQRCIASLTAMQRLLKDHSSSPDSKTLGLLLSDAQSMIQEELEEFSRYMDRLLFPSMTQVAPQSSSSTATIFTTGTKRPASCENNDSSLQSDSSPSGSIDAKKSRR